MGVASLSCSGSIGGGIRDICLCVNCVHVYTHVHLYFLLPSLLCRPDLLMSLCTLLLSLAYSLLEELFLFLSSDLTEGVSLGPHGCEVVMGTHCDLLVSLVLFYLFLNVAMDTE